MIALLIHADTATTRHSPLNPPTPKIRRLTPSPIAWTWEHEPGVLPRQQKHATRSGCRPLSPACLPPRSQRPSACSRKQQGVLCPECRLRFDRQAAGARGRGGQWVVPFFVPETEKLGRTPGGGGRGMGDIRGGATLGEGMASASAFASSISRFPSFEFVGQPGGMNSCWASRPVSPAPRLDDDSSLTSTAFVRSEYGVWDTSPV